MGFRRHKYGMSANGSKLEKAVGELIRLRERAGELDNVREQVRLRVCCIDDSCKCKWTINYVVDFMARSRATGEDIAIEAKGIQTPEWRIKRRLYWHYGKNILEIWGGHYKNPSLLETIIPRS